MSIQADVARYISHGFRPIPMWGVTPEGACRCGGLLPTGKPCRAGKHAPEPIESEWKETRYTPSDFQDGMNLALALGPWKPGRWLVCLDFDGLPADYDGTPFFTLPPTLTQQSPRGRHLFFTVPEYEPLGNWVDVFRCKDTPPYLDVFYARGRVNAAPSKNPWGAYRWLDWREPAALPSEVTERIYDTRRAFRLPVADSWDRGAKMPGT